VTISADYCYKALRANHAKLRDGEISRGEWATQVYKILHARYPNDPVLRQRTAAESVERFPWRRMNTPTENPPHVAA
jgi:hypothetical protein